MVMLSEMILWRNEFGELITGVEAVMPMATKIMPMIWIVFASVFIFLRFMRSDVCEHIISWNYQYDRKIGKKILL